MKTLSILLITRSAIMAQGLSAIITAIARKRLSVTAIEPEALPQTELTDLSPDIIIADPLSLSPESIIEIRRDLPVNTIIVGLYTSALPSNLTALFDSTISVYSPKSSIEALIEKAESKQNAETEPTEELTPREKEIVIGIVKGFTNKEIASKLNVSVHTVMTHRRNISNKLRIHSPAALTIYAIARKLIPVDTLT